MKIIEKWYKKWSVWLLAAATAVAGVAPYLPEAQAYLPDDWYRYAFLVILIARVIAQK